MAAEVVGTDPALARSVTRGTGGYRVPSLRGARVALGATVLLQLALGVLTVLTGVNLVLAVAHQAVGFLLASASVWALYELRQAR